jgi:pimeloyl-ACP methyl ester carboxylesterase
MDNPPAVEGVTHRWIAAGGLDVHVACAAPRNDGAAKHVPLVLVHGWPQHWWCWRHVIGPLSSDRAVFAIDLRGQGWTAAPDAGYDKFTLANDLVATVEALGLDQVDLVGHDWGGWVSLLVAQKHPELVHRVVAVAILAPWGRVSKVPNPALVYLPLAGGPAGPFLHRALGQIFLRIALRLGRADWFHRWPRSEVEPYLERFRRPDRARAGALLYRTFLSRELLPYMRGRYSPELPDRPVLLLPGQHDLVNKPRLVATALGPGADIQCEVVADSGHLIPEEQPEELIRRIRRFLDRP